MSDPTNAPNPTIDGGQGAGDPAPNSDPAKVPQWEGEFDPERAARLVANLRAENERFKARARAEEDAKKTELEKAQERIAELQREADTARVSALRAAAVAKHGIPADLADLVSGSSAEEIDATAERLAKRLAPSAPADPGPLPGRPRLTPGHNPDNGGDAFDPDAVIKAARRGF